VRGSHVGSYLPSSGVWHHTQRYLKRKNNDSNIVKHVDFDAPTREGAQLLPDDKVGYHCYHSQIQCKDLFRKVLIICYNM
jgi:nuclear pore complex protein Nup107